VFFNAEAVYDRPVGAVLNETAVQGAGGKSAVTYKLAVEESPKLSASGVKVSRFEGVSV
jgi:hypothetical protein